MEFFNTFSYNFTTVILPIFLQICVGFTAQKFLRLDLKTLSTIQFYVFIPALMFSKIYHGTLEGSTVIDIILSAVLIFACMLAIGFLVSYIFRFKKSMRNAFVNTVSLFNSGNYCIPLMRLLYDNDPFVMSAQAVIMVTQNVFTGSIGVLTASSGKAGLKQALKGMLRIPMIYVAVIAAVLKACGVVVWSPIISTLDIMSECLVPIALFTLGAQLAETKVNFKDYRIFLSNFIKLLVAPVVAFGVISLLGISGITAQVILIVVSAPTAVNVLILAMQYENEVDFTGQTVFSATVLSSVTVTAVIYFALHLFK